MGGPADWRIVVWDRGACELESFACDLIDVLAGLATGAIAPRGFPDDLHEAVRRVGRTRPDAGQQRSAFGPAAMAARILAAVWSGVRS